MRLKTFYLTVICVVMAVPLCQAARIVFDASCIPMAGDADWVIDSDFFPFIGGQSNPQRIPSPSQCEIGAATDEAFWTGGYSAWGIELVKAGHWVETIPRNATLTYGDCDNTQDLSFYDVLVIPEPQLAFSESEIQAILDFVYDGGGLFMVANHCGSDRNGNGYDSPTVFSEFNIIETFGLEFEFDPAGGIHDFCDWDEWSNRNFTDDLNDPFIYGPFGDVNAIGFYSATGIILHPEFNATATGHAWRNNEPHGNINVTVASAEFGLGRVAAIGDSAPADDGTGDPRDFLADGWGHSTTANDFLMMNMTEWLTESDLPPQPTRTPCPNHTPYPFCQGTATPSAPTPTPTPPPGTDPALDIYLNQPLYTGGDDFILGLDITNPGPSIMVDLYIALQVADLWFFYPVWQDDVSSQRRYLPSGGTSSEKILEFVWPQNAGQINDVKFWTVMLDPASSTMVGDYDVVSFSAY